MRVAHRVRRVRFVITGIVTGVLLCACGATDPPPFRTVPGPESWQILTGLQGHFTLGDSSLPCYPVRTLDPLPAPHCVARALAASGWDSAVSPERADAVLRMRIVPGGKTKADATSPLTVTLERLTDCDHGEGRCTGNVETIATWTRTPDGDLYRQPLALSPDGRFAAVVPASHLLKGPGYSGRIAADARFRGLRHVGELMLVDLTPKAVRGTGIDVVGDQPISWSADGKRLLIVRAEAVDALPPRFAREIVGDVGHAGQGVPMVETFDVESGTLTMLAIGLQPLWSPDDRTLLFQPAHDRIETLDLDTRFGRAVVLPGMSTRYEAIAVAFVAPRKVLYWALPTDGATVAFTGRNSPLVGAKQLLSLKVADLDSGSFATVYADLDPRARVGYSAN